MYPPVARRIDPAILRPRRRWFVVAGVVAFVGIVVGGVIFAVVLLSVLNEAKPVATFGSGQTVTVSLVASPRPAIYVSDPGSLSGRCTVTSSSGQQVPITQLLNVETLVFGGQRWQVGYHIDVPGPGEYRVTCTGPAARYGVGTPPSTARLIGAILALVLIPGVSIVIAVIITVVVLVRRGRNRRRLLAETGPPPY